jgi:hypothetical protein
MTPEEALLRVEKIVQLCNGEKWTTLETIYAVAMAYVIMCKALEEDDSSIMGRIMHVAKNIQVPSVLPKEIH